MGIQTLAMLTLALLPCLAVAQESREYKAWSACKVGSWVKLKTTIEKGGSTAVSEQTMTLMEITPGKLILEQTGTVSAKGKTQQLPVQKLEVTPEEGNTGKVVKKGDEELTIGGKKVKCHWEEIHIEADGAKSVSKMWTSLDVPGATVRMDCKITGKDPQTIKMLLLDWEKK